MENNGSEVRIKRKPNQEEYPQFHFVESDEHLLFKQEDEKIITDDDLQLHIKKENELIVTNDYDQLHIKKEEELIITNDDDQLHIKKEELIITDAGIEEKAQPPAINGSICSTSRRHASPYPPRQTFHQCPYCDHKSVRAWCLNMHLKCCHADEKPYQCSDCEYKSVTVAQLKSHIKYCHTDEKPHQCPHCEYKSVAAGQLKVHIMSRHTGEKPHQCPNCEYRSVTSKTLKKHIMSNHKIWKPWQLHHHSMKEPSRDRPLPSPIQDTNHTNWKHPRPPSITMRVTLLKVTSIMNKTKIIKNRKF